MRKKINGIMAGALALSTVGCASQPEDIQAQYVSPLTYQSYSCEQLRHEMMMVHRRVQEVSGAQKSQADGDAVALGVGMVLFWPALFFMIGKDKSEELGRLKGEYEALEKAANRGNCHSLLTEIANEREIERIKLAEKKKKEEAETANQYPR